MKLRDQASPARRYEEAEAKLKMGFNCIRKNLYLLLQKLSVSSYL